MEYTQWDNASVLIGARIIFCLNPCCNGIYSMRKQKLKSLSSGIPS